MGLQAFQGERRGSGSMREILISLLILAVIVGLDGLGLEASGVRQLMRLLRFEPDGVWVGGLPGGRVSLLAIVIGVCYVGVCCLLGRGRVRKF